MAHDSLFTVFVPCFYFLLIVLSFTLAKSVQNQNRQFAQRGTHVRPSLPQRNGVARRYTWTNRAFSWTNHAFGNKETTKNIFVLDKSRIKKRVKD